MLFHREQHSKSSRIRLLQSVIHVFVTYVWVHVCVHVSACLEVVKLNMCLYVCVPVCGNQRSTMDVVSPFFALTILWQDPLLSLRLIRVLRWLTIIMLEILLSSCLSTKAVPCLAFGGMIGIQIQVFMLDQQSLYWQLSTQPYKFDFLLLQWKVKRKINTVLYMTSVFNYTFCLLKLNINYK